MSDLIQISEHQLKGLLTEVAQTAIKAVYEGAEVTRQKHNNAGTPVSSPYASGGLLTYPGTRPGAISAIVQPRTWLDVLPLRKSVVQNDIQRVFTELTAAQGSNPQTTCGTAARPGNLKVTNIVNRFGTMYIQSDTVNLVDVGEYDTHAVMPETIQNYALSGSPLVPEPLRDPRINTASQSALVLFKLGSQVARMFGSIEIDGDNTQAYTATELGWIAEFNGLSRHIINGTTDAISGTASPAADALVETWGAAVDATSGGINLPILMTDMYFSRRMLAKKIGMPGVIFAWVMDERLFRSLCYVWSCVYAYTRCVTAGAGSAAEPISRTMQEVEGRFNEMYNGQYLLCDNVRVPVLFTSGAEVTETALPYTGRIYLVPLEWNGEPLISLEYKPFDTADWAAFLQFFGDTTALGVYNNGLYAMSTRSGGFCAERLLASKMRIRLDYRLLSGAIGGVTFQPYKGYRDWDPAGSSFYGGGVAAYAQYTGS